MHISLQPLTPADYGLVAGWLGDPEINRWLYAEWRCRPIDERLVALACNRNRLWLVVVGKVPYGLVAVGGVHNIDRNGVLWYLRGSGVDRQPGVMTTAVAEVVGMGFTELGLHSLSASVQAAFAA